MNEKTKLGDKIAGSKKAALAAVILPVLFCAALICLDGLSSENTLPLIFCAVFFCIALVNYLDMKTEKKSINSPAVIVLLILSLIFAAFAGFIIAVSVLNGGTVIPSQR